jgi:hypothetical protein
METTMVTIKGVQVFINEEAANVQLQFDKTIKGFTKADDGTYTEGDVTHISFFRSRLTAQLCQCSDDIAMYRATLDHAFGQKELGIILFNAKLKLNRELHKAGEVIKIGDKETTLDRDCYITDIVGVTLSERALRCLDAAITL